MGPWKSDQRRGSSFHMYKQPTISIFYDVDRVTGKSCSKIEVEETRAQEPNREENGPHLREISHNQTTTKQPDSHKQGVEHPKLSHEDPIEKTQQIHHRRRKDNETITKYMKKRVELSEQQSDLATQQKQLLQQQTDLCRLQMEISQQQTKLSQQLEELTQHQMDIVSRRNELAEQLAELSSLIDDAAVNQLFLYASCAAAKHKTSPEEVSTTTTVADSFLGPTHQLAARAAPPQPLSKVKSEPTWYADFDDDSDSSVDLHKKNRQAWQ